MIVGTDIGSIDSNLADASACCYLKPGTYYLIPLTLFFSLLQLNLRYVSGSSLAAGISNEKTLPPPGRLA